MRNLEDIKVLIGCETSSAMGRAFADLGFDTWNCDVLPANDRSNHHLLRE